MTISFDDIPVAPEAAFLSGPGRRCRAGARVLRTVAGAATAVAFGALETVNAAVAKAAYFQEYTQHPRRSVRARRIRATRTTRKGLKCGPSLDLPDLLLDAAEHPLQPRRLAPGRAPSAARYYTQRPNQCWAGTYEGWRWKFKDGHTYRCSDGYRFTSRGATKTICPWSV